MQAQRRRTGAMLSFVLLASLIGFSTAVLAQDRPLLKVLEQFTAPDVPKLGPTEPGPTTRTWWDPTTQPSTQPVPPGNGLAQHPMLYAGEGYNTLFLVNDGKVVWTYSSGRGGEIDDIWLMSNGHILYSRM